MQSRPERLYRPLPQQTDGEMNQVEKAARFSELHVKGAPLLLYNAWDAGTQSGAALATVVGVLVEVPVMLSVVRIVLWTREWYEHRHGALSA